MDNVTINWQAVMSTKPSGEDTLLWCLHNVNIAPGRKGFDSWQAVCAGAVDSALKACNIKASDERKSLLALGLAAWTFDFTSKPITVKLKCASSLQAAASYTGTDDADVYALWHVLQALAAYYRLAPASNLHGLMETMQKMNKIRSRAQLIIERLQKESEGKS